MIWAFRPRGSFIGRFRVRITPPITPNPISIIAQVEGSGTPLESIVSPSISAKGGWPSGVPKASSDRVVVLEVAVNVKYSFRQGVNPNYGVDTTLVFRMTLVSEGL